jgi:hypothetical protein
MNYLDRVMDVYQSEILGEGLFSRLAELSSGEERRDKFSTLLQLESEAKVRLRPLLCRLGLSVVEDEEYRRRGRVLAERLAAQSWDASLRDFGADIDDYIARYRALADGAPAEDQAELHFMVRHEEALRAFLVRELHGRPGESLDLVISLLEHPLPRAVRAS